MQQALFNGVALHVPSQQSIANIANGHHAGKKWRKYPPSARPWTPNCALIRHQFQAYNKMFGYIHDFRFARDYRNPHARTDEGGYHRPTFRILQRKREAFCTCGVCGWVGAVTAGITDSLALKAYGHAFSDSEFDEHDLHNSVFI